jgi:2-polyprenyl-3-methyl-5-hydroxy-6-metoxy-1,4-benzoquinol methylase
MTESVLIDDTIDELIDDTIDELIDDTIDELIDDTIDIVGMCVFCCMLCDNKECSLVYDNIRGDDNNEFTVQQCNRCGHTQLFPYQYDHEEHYEDDKQTEYVVEKIGTPFEKMIEYQELEHTRRVQKVFDVSKNNTINNVLDVGCGYGTYLSLFKNHTQAIDTNITGIDMSNYRIEKGKQMYDLQNINMISGIVDTAFSSTHTEQFDVITLWNVLEHVPDPMQLINDCYKMLKKDGCFYIEVPNADDELLQLSPGFRNYYYMKDHLSYFSKQTFNTMMHRLNIKNYTITGHQSYGIFNYMHWIKNNTPQRTDPDMHPGTDRLWIETLWRTTKESNLISDHLHLIIRK